VIVVIPSHGILAFLILLQTLTGYALAGEFDNLEDLQDHYETSHQLWEAKADVQLERVLAQYTSAVDGLAVRAKRARDLDRFQAAMAEQAHLEEHGKPGEVDVSKDYPDLDHLRNIYAKRERQHAWVVARARIAWTDEYAGALGALSKALTREGEIDSAAKVHEAYKALQVDPAYRVAKAYVANPGKALEDKPRPVDPAAAASPTDAANGLMMHVKTVTGLHAKAGSTDIVLTIGIGEEYHPLQTGNFVFQGLVNYFGPFSFKQSPDAVKEITIKATTGDNAWHMSELVCQFFQGDRQSKPYQFASSRWFFSTEENDGIAVPQRVFPLVEGLQLDQPRTVLIPLCHFAIVNDNQRSLNYPFRVPGPNGERVTVSIGIGSGIDDSGDKAVRFKVLDQQGNLVHSGKAGTKEVHWIDCLVRRGASYVLVLEDQDTRVGSGGNTGTIQVLLK
jgi:hypothetical protein